MKNYYLVLLLLSTLTISGQSKCDNATSYLGNAYAHVKDSYESNNISHLKQYAYRSVESLRLAIGSLGSCNCDKAIENAEKSLDLLVKVEDAETYEDGRFFVKRARDINKENLTVIDMCAYNQFLPQGASAATVAAVSSENASNSQLSELQQQQEALKQQQEALQLKAAQIKEQLAQQKSQELTLKKQQAVQAYKNRISENVKSYNESLKTYCSNAMPIVFTSSPIDLESNGIPEIKTYYLNEMKTVTKIYLDALNSCN